MIFLVDYDMTCPICDRYVPAGEPAARVPWALAKVRPPADVTRGFPLDDCWIISCPCGDVPDAPASAAGGTPPLEAPHAE
jgi:hypothetical protein